IRFKSVLTSNCIAGLWFLFSAGRNTGPKPRSAFSSLRSNPVARASAASSGSSLSQRSIHPRRLFGGAVSGGNELSNSSSRSRRSLRVTDSLARPNRRANQRPITSNPRPDYPRIVPHSRLLFVVVGCTTTVTPVEDYERVGQISVPVQVDHVEVL